MEGFVKHENDNNYITPCVINNAKVLVFNYFQFDVWHLKTLTK